MSGSAEILQEYLVEVGFQTDAGSRRKFEEGLAGVTKHVVSTGFKVAGIIASVEAATSAFAYSMRKVYFAAELSGTSVSKLKSLEFAGKQIGISAEQMDAAVHNMATALRLNPGKIALLDSLTGLREEGKDTVDQLMDLVKATESMPEYIGARYAQEFGINSDTYHQMREHLAKLLAEQKKAQGIFQQYGVNFKDLKKETEAYTETLDVLKLKFEALATVMLSRFEPIFNKLAKGMGDVMQLTSVKEGAGLIAKGKWMDASFVTPAGDFGKALLWKAQGLSDAEIAKRLSRKAPPVKAVPLTQTPYNLRFGAPEHPEPHTATKAPAAHTPEIAHPTDTNNLPRDARNNNLPRDARNNNPGNIKYGDFARSHGAIGRDINGFAIFPNMVSGFAASQDLLKIYGASGKNTVGSIVGTWAPAADHNDTGAYVKDVAGGLGVKADTPLDMNDPETLVRLSQLMATHEGLPKSMLGAASHTKLGVAAASTPLNVNQHTEIKVTSTGAPADVARAVANQQTRVNADLVRNLKGSLS